MKDRIHRVVRVCTIGSIGRWSTLSRSCLTILDNHRTMTSGQAINPRYSFGNHPYCLRRARIGHAEIAPAMPDKAPMSALVLADCVRASAGRRPAIDRHSRTVAAIKHPGRRTTGWRRRHDPRRTISTTHIAATAPLQNPRRTCIWLVSAKRSPYRAVPGFSLTSLFGCTVLRGDLLQGSTANVNRPIGEASGMTSSDLPFFRGANSRRDRRFALPADC